MPDGRRTGARSPPAPPVGEQPPVWRGGHIKVMGAAPPPAPEYMFPRKPREQRRLAVDHDLA
jgi:hypothetical protein